LEPGFTILLERYGAVYVDIAKVASSSLKAAFAAVLGLDLGNVDGNPHELEYPRPTIVDPTGNRMFPGMYAFAFVRNPWDRLVSCYRDKIAGEVADFTTMSASGVARCLARFDAFWAGMPFEAFVRAVAAIPDADADEHFRSQHCNLTNAHGDIAVDFVGRYENLQSDFLRVARTIGLPPGITLPRLQSNPRRVDYAAFYTTATRDVVAARFARDVGEFGYQFG
jgi:chondroitin 4-sulfotransferase 11